MNRSLALLTVTGILAGLAAAAAHAGMPDGDLPSKAVRFHPAELLSGAGVAHVHRRLEGAAREVCQAYGSRELARQRAFRQCTAVSLARAVAEIHDPGLTAYHEDRMGAAGTLAALVAVPATPP